MNLVLNIENKNWNYRAKADSGGIHYFFDFKNGWGASVIKFYGSYGYEQDLWELAVLKNKELHYDNPVANGDVCGYLTDKEVNRLLRQIENFK